MKTWAIANQKGGVGKTTTTLSIGRGLASRGLRVLMLDLDPHSSLTRAFGVPDEPAPRGVVDLFDPAPPALAELAMPHRPRHPPTPRRRPPRQVRHLPDCRQPRLPWRKPYLRRHREKPTS